MITIIRGVLSGHIFPSLVCIPKPALFFNFCLCFFSCLFLFYFTQVPFVMKCNSIRRTVELNLKTRCMVDRISKLVERIFRISDRWRNNCGKSLNKSKCVKSTSTIRWYLECIFIHSNCTASSCRDQKKRILIITAKSNKNTVVYVCVCVCLITTFSMEKNYKFLHKFSISLSVLITRFIW